MVRDRQDVFFKPDIWAFLKARTWRKVKENQSSDITVEDFVYFDFLIVYHLL